MNDEERIAIECITAILHHDGNDVKTLRSINNAVGEVVSSSKMSYIMLCVCLCNIIVQLLKNNAQVVGMHPADMWAKAVKERYLNEG